MASLQSKEREERARRNARAISRAREALEAREAANQGNARAPLVVRSLVGGSVRRARSGGALVVLPSPGPAYTLSPEPMTTKPLLDAGQRPRSVWSALLTLDARTYVELVRLAYGCTRAEARGTLIDSLLYEATQTARYEPRPGGGWNVWIDSQGRARVEVHP